MRAANRKIGFEHVFLDLRQPVVIRRLGAFFLIARRSSACPANWIGNI